MNDAMYLESSEVFFLSGSHHIAMAGCVFACILLHTMMQSVWWVQNCWMTKTANGSGRVTQVLLGNIMFTLLLGDVMFMLIKSTGIRMLDQPFMTDIIEASSISHMPQVIDIYSASWGPTDNGKTVDGPRELTLQAMADGVNKVTILLNNWGIGSGGYVHTCSNTRSLSICDRCCRTQCDYVNCLSFQWVPLMFSLQYLGFLFLIMLSQDTVPSCTELFSSLFSLHRLFICHHSQNWKAWSHPGSRTL